MSTVRPPAVAGMFYPEDRNELHEHEYHRQDDWKQRRQDGLHDDNGVRHDIGWRLGDCDQDDHLPRRHQHVRELDSSVQPLDH